MTISKKTLYMVMATILYACIVTFFPWDYITKADGFRDFEAYVEYYNSVEVTKIELYGWTYGLQYFTGEALWDVLVLWLTSITGEAEIALRIVTFFICMVWGIFLFSRMPVFWSMIFLLNPISIDVAVSGIRNGFGWSLIIVGLMVSQKFIRYPTYAMAPFIHSTSAAFLALIFSVNKLLPLVRSKVGAIFIASGSGIAIALALTVFNEIVLSAIGDRRVGEAYVRGGGSFLQMLFFVILLATQLMCGVNYIKKHGLVISLLSWYILMNPFISWSYRVWGAAIPLIAYAIWELPRRKRQVILYLWLGYLVLWYFYWTKLFDYWYFF